MYYTSWFLSLPRFFFCLNLVWLYTPVVWLETQSKFHGSNNEYEIMCTIVWMSFFNLSASEEKTSRATGLKRKDFGLVFGLESSRWKPLRLENRSGKWTPGAPPKSLRLFQKCCPLCLHMTHRPNVIVFWNYCVLCRKPFMLFHHIEVLGHNMWCVGLACVKGLNLDAGKRPGI